MSIAPSPLSQSHPVGTAPRFPGLAAAGLALGMSGDALRKKFERGDLPRQFLLRVGPRTLRVDLEALIRYLKSQAEEKAQGECSPLGRTA